MKDSRREAVITAMLLAAGLLPMNAKAYISFPKGGEELIHTLHLYSPTLSLPSSNGKKVATVCFVTDTRECAGHEFDNSDDMENNGLPDGGGNPDYDLNDAERCRNEGYTISGCPDGFEPSGKCPYGDYYAKCVEACPSSYKTCEPPYYGVGEMCGGKYASCEEDTERACKELNPDYTDSCESGWQINPNDKCKYDSSFGTCCNQCVGYGYTEIPEGYVQDGAACTDCNGQTKYKVKPNPCDGFLDCGSAGPMDGASSCQSGLQTKYDNCKPCPNLGTLTSCPSPYICEYEECSNRYYKSGCQSGYDWDPITQTCNEQCENKGTLTSCPSPFTCTYEACSGKYYKSGCKSGYDWNASSQTCTQCDSSYKYTCSGAGYFGGSGLSCGGKYQSCKCSSPYVWNGTKCVHRCNTGGQIGYILNSDMSLSAGRVSGKTPIGVVVYSSAVGRGQAFALNDLDGTYAWSTENVDVSGLSREILVNSSDFLSCERSATIRAQGDSSKYPAAWAAYSYTTSGTKVGDWCLPAARLFYCYYDEDYIKAIKTQLENVGGSGIDNSVWTSNVFDSYDAYRSGSVYQPATWYFKETLLKVRPVIEF